MTKDIAKDMLKPGGIIRVPPEEIYLVPIEVRDNYVEYIWADEPAPGLEDTEDDAVKYVRADLVPKRPL